MRAFRLNHPIRAIHATVRRRIPWLLTALALLAPFAPLGCGLFTSHEESSPPREEARPEPTPYEVMTSAERRARWNRDSNGAETGGTNQETARASSAAPEINEHVPPLTVRPGERRAPEANGPGEFAAPSETADEREVAMATAPLRPVDPNRREEVIRLYRDVYLRALATPANWRGDIDRCDAGENAPEYTEATRSMVNYFRTMAGVRGDIVFDERLSAKCRKAALSFIATPGLSHRIPSSWACYSNEGNEAAGRSNIALGYSGPLAIAAYMEEPWSKNFDLTHRQWILYPLTRRMGSGSVAVKSRGYRGANALWVEPLQLGPKARRTKWIAWPPAGYVPYPVVFGYWSVGPHVEGRIDFSRATVTMTDAATGKKVSVRKGISNSAYAPDAAIAWAPEGLNFGAGMKDQTFQIEVRDVRVSGKYISYRYGVTVIDPGGA